MKLFGFMSTVWFIKPLLKAKRLILKAKEPVVDITLDTLRHFVKRLKGKTNV